MATMEKPDPDTVRIFDQLGAGLAGERRLMFGCPALFAGGNMFAGVFGRRIFFRVAAADQGDWLAAHPGLRSFEPVPGRPMKEYLEVPVGDTAPDFLAEALELARDCARSLPPKPAKTRKQT